MGLQINPLRVARLAPVLVLALAAVVATPPSANAGNECGSLQLPAPQHPQPLGPVVSTYYFAEGSTQPPFQTWFLVSNPTANTAVVRFTFMLENGTTQVNSFAVNPGARLSLLANDVLRNATFATKVEADQRVIAERTMFVSFDGNAQKGITTPSKTWLFAEGSTQSPFQTWVLLQNPNSVPANNVNITYVRPDGSQVVQPVGPIAPTSRKSVFANPVIPDSSFAIRIDSDQPIVAARSMYRFPGDATSSVAGTSTPGNNLYFATFATLREQTPLFPMDAFLLLYNPQQAPAVATITTCNSRGETRSVQVGVSPNSRQTVYTNDIEPNESFCVQVQSTQPIVAEMSESVGPEPDAFAGIISEPNLAFEWDFADGSTQPPFVTIFCMVNPNNEFMVARFDMTSEDGQQTATQYVGVPAHSRRMIQVAESSNSGGVAFSTKVTTSLPSVVGRRMVMLKADTAGGIGITATLGFPR